MNNYYSVYFGTKTAVAAHNPLKQESLKMRLPTQKLPNLNPKTHFHVKAELPNVLEHRRTCSIAMRNGDFPVTFYQGALKKKYDTLELQAPDTKEEIHRNAQVILSNVPIKRKTKIEKTNIMQPRRTKLTNSIADTEEYEKLKERLRIEAAIQEKDEKLERKFYMINGKQLKW
ncbi:Hypothetical_protein [Hexamita inflata]|uniref:Hypothetical_protein n=1 Tax=Hexamita inflata TaxID=28002 RepID=A0AA86NGA6_9EUKA|nr:Hypothetical protein HINF_LOCUS6203 [Hexamita inflata]CAI9918573.1 Hypothetical protein HINF_LOCUS6218 [Hexamita inflata]